MPTFSSSSLSTQSVGPKIRSIKLKNSSNDMKETANRNRAQLARKVEKKKKERKIQLKAKAVPSISIQPLSIPVLNAKPVSPAALQSFQLPKSLIHSSFSIGDINKVKAKNQGQRQVSQRRQQGQSGQRGQGRRQTNQPSRNRRGQTNNQQKSTVSLDKLNEELDNYKATSTF
jgi:hypothetical protein